jgi:hypothetical protein
MRLLECIRRIIERLVALHNGTVVVFDPHGEYGRAFQGGNLQFNPNLGNVTDTRDQLTIPVIQDTIQRLQAAGAGIAVYTPQNPSFRFKYAGKNNELALQFDHFEMDDIAEILPGLTEPQQRVLDVAMRSWRTVDRAEPRDIDRLRNLLGEGIDELRQWDQLAEALLDVGERIGWSRVDIVIDPDPYMVQVGYGTEEALKRLCASGACVRKADRLRLGPRRRPVRPRPARSCYRLRPWVEASNTAAHRPPLPPIR